MEYYQNTEGPGPVPSPWIRDNAGPPPLADSSNRTNSRTGRLWMDEYYDYVIRSKRDLVEKLRYVHNNPVKKGLVENEEDYPFSSANPIYNEFLFREF